MLTQRARERVPRGEAEGEAGIEALYAWIYAEAVASIERGEAEGRGGRGGGSGRARGRRSLGEPGRGRFQRLDALLLKFCRRNSSDMSRALRSGVRRIPISIGRKPRFPKARPTRTREARVSSPLPRLCFPSRRRLRGRRRADAIEASVQRQEGATKQPQQLAKMATRQIRLCEFVAQASSVFIASCYNTHPLMSVSAGPFRQTFAFACYQ